MTRNPQRAGVSDLEALLWGDACLAIDIFALLVRERAFSQAGLLVHAKAGPVRDIWMQRFQAALPLGKRTFRIPATVSPDRLIGGLDVSATLASGKPQIMRGLLAGAHENIVVLPMADLAAPETISPIASALDSGLVSIEREGFSRSQPACFGLVAFDESEGADDGVGQALADRLTLHIDLADIGLRAAREPVPLLQTATDAATLADEQREHLCRMAAAFGLPSLRPALQVVALAKAHCRLKGRTAAIGEDIEAAVRLGLLRRARQMPAPPPDGRQEDGPGESANQSGEDDIRESSPDAQSPDAIPDEIVLDALQSALPSGLLEQLQARLDVSSAHKGAGRRGGHLNGSKRGRPQTSRKGELRSGNRLDLVATLRTAAPWQKLRRRQTGLSARLDIRRSDICVRRYRQRSETSTIFVVDASGSTALNRLAEAKGAIEILLGESYVRRDHVALVSFRGTGAEVLLPPTRALARAKRSLAALPGGGGTPLASGLRTALLLALDEQRRGRTPAVIVMTDGSANVDAAGAGGRKLAAEDAATAARSLGAAGLDTILVDIGRQPQDKAKNLARIMGAAYVAMPFASSKNLSDAVRAHQ